MKRVHFIGIIVFFSLFISPLVNAQEEFMDDRTISLLDSLNLRISQLEKSIPRLSETRDPAFYFTKSELDRTIFLTHYHRLLFEEELDKAKEMVDDKLKIAEKRRSESDIKFYSDYKKHLNGKIKEQQMRYQQLFAKEKNFKKEIHIFLDRGDEYSLQRAERMITLALKYAREKGLKTVTTYLSEYKNLVTALLSDYYSDYDLNEITGKEKKFKEIFDPLIESDSIEMIEEANELIDQCYNYSKNAHTDLDTTYFRLQQKVVTSAVQDYYKRIGYSSSLNSMAGELVIAKRDSLNKEGIYRWNDYIIVISSFIPDANSVNVITGQAIIDADNKLIDYIRINRIAKIRKSVRFGNTFVVPYLDGARNTDFLYIPDKKKFQYIVCYTQIESSLLTRKVGSLLAPLQFEYEIDNL